MMPKDDFDRMVGMLFAALVFAALLIGSCLSEARAEGWFNPGVEGGGSGTGEHDLDGNRLYGDKADDPNTYCWHAAADTWRCVAGGVDVLDCTASGCTVAGELSGVTSLDSTTLATIVAAISGNGSEYDDDAPVCWGDDDDFCIEHDTDGSPDGLRLTQKDCDGSPCDPLEFYKDGGANVVALRASSVTNPDAKMTFGPAAASGHGATTGDAHFTGDKFEVDGTAYFNSSLYVLGSLIAFQPLYIGGSGGNYPVISNGKNQTNNPLQFLTNDSNYILISPRDDGSTNYGHSDQADLTIIMQSNDETDVGQFFALSWNRLALGGDGGGHGCINQTISYADFTDGGGASGTLVLDEGIPDGAVVQRAILHSLTGFTGDTSAFVQIGDGTDVDRYSTGTPSVFTTNPSGCELREPSGTAWHDNAKSVTVTITSNADFTSVSAGEATVAICYWTP
jgi:hypothetical protein